MPPDPIDRQEFEGYIRRHEADQFAHAPMRHDFRNDLLGAALSTSARLDALEHWRDRILGAMAMLTFLVSAGAIAGVIELLRK